MKKMIAIVMVLMLAFAGVAIAEKAYTPSVNDKFDLGTNKLQYKDLRLGGSAIFEGATHDAYETTLTVTDPTADRTVTFPDADLNFATGVTSDQIAADAVGTSEANINTVTLLIANKTSTNAVTVDATHTLLSFYITTIGGINGANLINAPFYDGAGGWRVSMVNALLGGDAVYTFNFLETN